MEQIKELYQHFLNSTGVSTDTRKIEQGNVFFALKGPNFNGNTYAEQALEKGASLVVIDEAAYAIEGKTFLVDDVLAALQALATHHRQQLNIPVIGIGGSNGKTTTKELTYAVLSKKYKTFATKGNLNNHIGVPLSLLSISADVEIAVLELGANHVGELELLCRIAEPSHGIITNNGLDHLEGYGSFEGVVKGNGELYEWLLKSKGTAFVSSKDEILSSKAAAISKVVTYGQAGDYFSAQITDNQFFIKVSTDKSIDIQTQLIGEYNIDNINTALCIGRYFGVDEIAAAKAIEEYVPANNRSQLLKKGPNTIILDCYNANPSSMMKSIESFSKLHAENKILLLGDMFELGSHSAKEHAALIDFVAEKGFSQVYFCGLEFEKAQHTYPANAFFATRSELEKHFSEYKPENAAFLIKGSRGMAMERLVEFI